jgi:hypothetical protein
MTVKALSARQMLRLTLAGLSGILTEPDLDLLAVPCGVVLQQSFDIAAELDAYRQSRSLSSIFAVSARSHLRALPLVDRRSELQMPKFDCRHGASGSGGRQRLVRQTVVQPICHGLLPTDRVALRPTRATMNENSRVLAAFSAFQFVQEVFFV